MLLISKQFRWLVLAGVLFSGVSVAETVPANLAPVYSYDSNWGETTIFNSPQETADGWVTWRKSVGDLDATAYNVTSGGFVGCHGYYQWCSGRAIYLDTRLQCPATGGWTLSGSNCTRPDCAEGTTRNESTGECTPTCSPPRDAWSPALGRCLLCVFQGAGGGDPILKVTKAGYVCQFNGATNGYTPVGQLSNGAGQTTLQSFVYPGQGGGYQAIPPQGVNSSVCTGF